MGEEGRRGRGGSREVIKRGRGDREDGGGGRERLRGQSGGSQ